MLAGKFTVAQRSRYQTLIIAEAQKNEEAARNIISTIQSFQKIQTIEPAKREELRLQVVPGIISAMENESSEINSLLLDIYRNGRDSTAAKSDTPADGTEANDAPTNARAGNGAVKVADLAGIWSTSSVSTECY
jgi:hypothetical protein